MPALLVVGFLNSSRFFTNSNKTFIPLGYGFKSTRITNAKGEINNFSLLDQNGVFHELYRNLDSKAIVIIGQQRNCENDRKTIPLVNELYSRYLNKKISFFYLNSEKEDSRLSLINLAVQNNIPFPILIDQSKLISEILGITHSGEAIVLDPNEWKIVYRGPIISPNQNSLSNFLENFLANKTTQLTKTNTNGCEITPLPSTPLSYEKVIAPIWKTKCLKCHVEESGILPTLNSYEKIRSWIEMSKETILTERMPPFSADTYYGSYKNNISLSLDEKRTLIKWIDQGAPRDGITDPLLNSANKQNNMKVFIENNFKKAYSLSMNHEIKIPPQGNTEYIYTQIGEAAPRDMWIGAIHFHSTNLRQLHHVAMLVVSKPLSFYKKSSEQFRKLRPNDTINTKPDGNISLFELTAITEYEKKMNPNYFRAQVWAAGRSQPFFVDSKANIFIPKGSYIILESHHMGSGRAETEKSSLDFYQRNILPKKPLQLRVKMLANISFKIPANANNFTVDTKEVTFSKDVFIVSFGGHLHMRGKSVKLSYKEPIQNEQRVFLSIPNYNYGWHTGAGLSLESPIFIKKGSRFTGSCTYDNSTQNPYNPDPTQDVPWGQRVDRSEMCNLMVSFYFAEDVK